jgi:pimeloyl-ACP methyl ester carboxylesterase
MNTKTVIALTIGIGAAIFCQAMEKPAGELLKDAGIDAKIEKGYADSKRYTFTFEGFKAYFDEPTNPKSGRKWMWCMKWPNAFAEYTGQIDGVKRGYYYVYLDNIKWMSPEGVKIAKRFRDFLVTKLKFADKAFLIGMSWGGFYSTRYAANHPQDIERIYIDAPVMNFASFPVEKWAEPAKIWNKPEGESWATDSRMPINLADKIAKAKIPVLLLYGGADTVVEPAGNCEIFIPRFKAAGGDITIFKRDDYRHHPHGFTDKADAGAIVDFFEGVDLRGKVSGR